MIILDTNVLSAVMAVRRDQIVVDWLSNWPPGRLFTTSVSEADIRYGISLLPQGSRRIALQDAADFLFENDFAGRILPFDRPAAREYAAVMAERRRRGRPIATLDAQIAAIARSRGAAVATRNTTDFDDCEVDLINPWDS